MGGERAEVQPNPRQNQARDTESESEESEETDDSRSSDDSGRRKTSSRTHSTASTATTARRLGEGTFRDRKILLTPALWPEPLAAEGPVALERALSKMFLPPGPPETFTDEVAELCVTVLCLLAGRGPDDEAQAAEQDQEDAKTHLMDMLVRVGASRAGASREELAKLARGIAGDAAPDRYKKHLLRLEKARSKAEVARPRPAQRAYRAPSRPRPAAATTPTQGGYIDQARWNAMVPAARAQAIARRPRRF